MEKKVSEQPVTFGESRVKRRRRKKKEKTCAQSAKHTVASTNIVRVSSWLTLLLLWMFGSDSVRSWSIIGFPIAFHSLPTFLATCSTFVVALDKDSQQFVPWPKNRENHWPREPGGDQTGPHALMFTRAT